MSKNEKEAKKAAPTKRNVRTNCSLKPLTTMKKISMTLGEDTASLLLSSSNKDVAAVPGPPTTSLTQHRSTKKKVLYYPKSDDSDDEVPAPKRRASGGKKRMLINSNSNEFKLGINADDGEGFAAPPSLNSMKGWLPKQAKGPSMVLPSKMQCTSSMKWKNSILSFLSTTGLQSKPPSLLHACKFHPQLVAR
jgi:hypothetical protein